MEFPYMIFYIFFYAGYMPLLLFLPVYFKYIGLGPAYVGLLNGIRPILQSIVTPFLVMVAERCRARKRLFVISYLIIIAKLLVIYLILRPRYQRCTIKYVHKPDHFVERETSHFVQNTLFKRRDDKTARGSLWDWSDTLKETATVKNQVLQNQRGGHTLTSKFQTTTKKNRTNFSGTALSRVLHNNISGSNSSQVIPAPSPSKSLHDNLEYFLMNDRDEIFRISIFLLILVLLGDGFDACLFTLVDVSCVANLDVEHYGFVRLWGNIGWGSMTPVIGVVIYGFGHDFCGAIVGSFHYVLFFTIGFLSLALLAGFPLDFNSSQMEVLTREIHGPSSNFNYSMFMFAASYAAFCNGFFLTFAYWFIDSLGGNALIMGTSTACKSLVDIALFFLIAKVCNYVGYQLVVNIGLVGHIVVFLIYFLIKDPWLVVIAETVHAMFYATVMSTCSTFLLTRAPTGSSPKMQDILHGIYWGFGTGFGSMFGGYYLEHSGFVETFTSFSVITSIVAIVFLFLQILSYLNDPESALDKIWTVWSLTSSLDGDYEINFNRELEEE